MTEQSTEIKLETASITDRGLNERRPLNEDSLLSDGERRIFAVADGVGGAEAGEVASQTAVEVLNEAFRHHKPGDDVEDLMELAIQRANTSIHQMAREHTKLATMATTVVAPRSVTSEILASTASPRTAIFTVRPMTIPWSKKRCAPGG